MPSPSATSVELGTYIVSMAMTPQMQLCVPAQVKQGMHSAVDTCL